MFDHAEVGMGLPFNKGFGRTKRKKPVVLLILQPPPLQPSSLNITNSPYPATSKTKGHIFVFDLPAYSIFGPIPVV